MSEEIEKRRRCDEEPLNHFKAKDYEPHIIKMTLPKATVKTLDDFLEALNALLKKTNPEEPLKIRRNDFTTIAIYHYLSYLSDNDRFGQRALEEILIGMHRYIRRMRISIKYAKDPQKRRLQLMRQQRRMAKQFQKLIGIS